MTVDQCTECRGIFLDRGELERLIDAEQSWHSAVRPPQQPPTSPQPSYQQPYGSYGDPRQRRRKKSFLDELFD